MIQRPIATMQISRYAGILSSDAMATSAAAMLPNHRPKALPAIGESAA